MAALPEGAHIPKKPRTDSAAASRHNAAMFVLDTGDPKRPADGQPGPASGPAAAGPSAATSDEVRREDVASAAAASNLVDFFQSAAQRWQTPALTGSATASGSAALLASSGSEPLEGADSQVPPASGAAPAPAGQALGSAVPAESVFQAPARAAIQSWQPCAAATGLPPAGALFQGDVAAPEPVVATPKAGAQLAPESGAGDPGRAPEKVLTALQELPVQYMPGALDAGAQKGAAQQVDAAQLGAVSSDKGAMVGVSEISVPTAALPAPAKHTEGKEAVPNLVTPAKEAVVPVGAARPFSAETA